MKYLVSAAVAVALAPNPIEATIDELVADFEARTSIRVKVSFEEVSSVLHHERRANPDRFRSEYWGRSPYCLAQSRTPSRSDRPTRGRRRQRRNARPGAPTIPSTDRKENSPD